MTASANMPEVITSTCPHPKRRKRKVSNSRTLALEQAYVHDVYSVLAANPESVSSPFRKHVKQFLLNEFEPGSLLLDIGCGDGKYLNLSSDLIVFGLEHCAEWFNNDRYRTSRDPQFLMVGNVLCLPFRDELFDGVLCCSVLHHISTLERRINALKEISRILKIGGKLMLTVTSGPTDAKDIESQDVLIQVNHLAKSDLHSESDIDSYSSSSTVSLSANSNFDYNACELNQSSPSSEFENCYSFVRKALKRFSLASSNYSFKNSNSSSSKSRFFNMDNYPIELRNLEEDSLSCCSKSSSTTGDSALSSFNRSSGLSQSSSSNIFPSSLLSLIKDQLTSWKVQIASSIEHWQMYDSRTSITANKRKSVNASNTTHRFSLPISLWKSSKPNESGYLSKSKHVLGKNKIYALNGFHNREVIHFLQHDATDEVEINLSQIQFNSLPEECENNPTTNADQCDYVSLEQNQLEDNRFNSINKIIFQKSFSSESSRKNSVHCAGYKLIAYYSMPELQTIYSLSESDIYLCERMRQNELHQRTHSVESRIEIDSHKKDDFSADNGKAPMSHVIQTVPEEDSLSPSPCSSTEPRLIETTQTPSEPLILDNGDSSIDQVNETPTSLDKTTNQGKFPKKLLRQRSFSADYQPETVKFQPELPRRFSASPNIGTHRYNHASHTPHHQQISMDSEESFVTIIAANRSTRDSMVDVLNFSDLTDFELEEEEEVDDDEGLNNSDMSPNLTYSYSSSSDENDEAYCESLSNEQQISNETSISSVLDVTTIRSVSQSVSRDTNEDLMDASSVSESSEEIASPPATLHHYYHLFRDGELEQLIEDHVQNLHVIDSFYNECAMSWCVVAEKVHVWTI